MLELRVPLRLFPSRLPTLRLWSPWLLPSGVRTLRLCACEFWWRFRSRPGRGLPRRRRAPLDPPMSDIPRVVFHTRGRSHDHCRAAGGQCFNWTHRAWLRAGIQTRRLGGESISAERTEIASSRAALPAAAPLELSDKPSLAVFPF